MLSCQESKAIALYCVILISSVNVRGNQYVAMVAIPVALWPHLWPYLLPCGHTCGHTPPLLFSCDCSAANVVVMSEASERRGALAPAMLKPQGREYLFAPAIFYHILFACCALNFHCLSLCCLHTIKTSHTGLSYP